MAAVFLDACMGICWSLVYILAIALGIQQKTWCIPAVSICLNFSWEFWVVTFRLIHGGASGLAFYTQLGWLILDIGVLLTLICYFPKKHFVFVGLVVSLMIGWVLLFRLEWFLEFAFLDNALMSLLFIRRKLRDGTKGDSRLIGEAKLLGTLSSTVLEGVLRRNFFALYVGGICLILDAYYLLLVTQKTERRSKKQCD